MRGPSSNIAHGSTRVVLVYLVERWFGEITRKRIRRGVFRSVSELIAAIEEFIRINNENPQAVRLDERGRCDLGKARSL